MNEALERNMGEIDSEHTFVSTAFGSVTNKRVVFCRGKGWFRGGSREDIPIKHITSVRLDIERNFRLFIIIALLLGVFAASTDMSDFFRGVLFFAFVAFLLSGSPSVFVNTAGMDHRAARGFPWQRREAKAFVETLRRQLFRE